MGLLEFLVSVEAEEKVMLVQPQSQSYTLDEYRTLEEKAEFRSEYHDGRMIPMS